MDTEGGKINFYKRVEFVLRVIVEDHLKAW